MNDKQAYQIIKEELDKYIVFVPHNSNIARIIVKKIHAYVVEETKYAESRRLYRVVTYRIASIVSEFIIVYLITGSIEFSIAIAPICMIVHSALHWLVDKLIR
jgi:uncharacterized membrane protein